MVLELVSKKLVKPVGAGLPDSAGILCIFYEEIDVHNLLLWNVVGAVRRTKTKNPTPKIWKYCPHFWMYITLKVYDTIELTL